MNKEKYYVRTEVYLYKNYDGSKYIFVKVADIILNI